MNAFKKMGHAKTELETELLLNSLDGLMIKMITSYDYDVESQVTLILKKYRLN
jgi:hypothetical protein